MADVLKCLGDNKKHMRECTLTALDSWVAAAQLDKMVPYIIVTLGDQKTGSEGRKDLFDWLSKHVTRMGDPSEALPLLKPSASSLMVSVEIELLIRVCLIYSNVFVQWKFIWLYTSLKRINLLKSVKLLNPL